MAPEVHQLGLFPHCLKVCKSADCEVACQVPTCPACIETHKDRDD